MTAPGLKDINRKKVLAVSLMGLSCIAAFIISVVSGAVKFSVSEILDALLTSAPDLKQRIILNIRIPRTIVAALTGASLSLSGAILQGVMRNSMASPNIIGVSAGAGFAGISILILFPHLIFLMPLIAFLGAFLTTITIYLISWDHGTNPLKLILSGIAVSAFLGAGLNTLIIFFPDRVHSAVDFMIGGLSAKTWIHVHMLWPYFCAGLIICLIMSQHLNILMLGDETAGSLGLNPERTRIIFIITASFLAAGAVSVAGLLGFAGLIVPHAVRLITGANYKFLFLGTALTGAALLMLCDTFARTALSPVELPVGIIMAFIGAPFFLYLVRNTFKNDN